MPRQAGFALMTVLLIVALVSIIASQLLYQQALNTQRSANMLHMAQSSSVVWGLENFIKQGLLLDAKNTQIDDYSEQWAQPLVEVDFEEGKINARLIDLQGLINLNNLQSGDAEVKQSWQKLLRRYLNLQQMDPALEVKITDWVDDDKETLPGGAESDYYLLKTPSYRAADQKMVLLQELGLLGDFNMVTIQRLGKHLTALPTETQINVNTAPVLVLMSLADWITPTVAESWLNARQASPAQNTKGFREYMKTATGFEQSEINESLPDSLITTKSNYFYLQGQVTYGDTQQNVSAIFFRKEDQQVNLVQRWIGITHE